MDSTNGMQIDQHRPRLPFSPNYNSLTTTEPVAPIKPHKGIPRPPNAFMLFRSDLLKRRFIPAHVESKQYNLSRVAGQFWKRMPEAGKQFWKSLSKEKYEEHMRKYPGYQYKPTKRGPVQKRKRATTKDQEVVHCAKLTETYLPKAIEPVQYVPETKPADGRKPRTEPHTVEPDNQAIQLASPFDPDPAFSEPLLPPSKSIARHLSSASDLEAPAETEMEEDNWPAEDQDKDIAPVLPSVEPKIPINAAAHIREKYEIARREALFSTAAAHPHDMQAFLYHPQPFIVSPGNENRGPVAPESPALSHHEVPNSSGRTSPQDHSTPASGASVVVSTQELPNFQAHPGSKKPQTFPITLTPEDLPLQPPEPLSSNSESRPKLLDTLTFSFDECSLEEVSADLAEGEFGLFGQPPSALRVVSDSMHWQSSMMGDILGEEICARIE